MSGQPTPAQQEQYLNRLRAEVQQQMAQELINKMSESCFKVTIGLLCFIFSFSFEKYWYGRFVPGKREQASIPVKRRA